MSGLPNLFVVGAAKAGTTSIYHYFKAHPQIYVSPTVKEANYMAYFNGLPHFTGPGDTTASAGRSVTNLPDYLALYADRTDEPVAADISPCYLHRPQAARKIAELCPRAKIVIVLRNPVESAFSMFSMMQRDGRETCDFFCRGFSPQPPADGGRLGMGLGLPTLLYVFATGCPVFGPLSARAIIHPPLTKS